MFHPPPWASVQSGAANKSETGCAGNGMRRSPSLESNSEPARLTPRAKSSRKWSTLLPRPAGQSLSWPTRNLSISGSTNRCRKRTTKSHSKTMAPTGTLTLSSKATAPLCSSIPFLLSPTLPSQDTTPSTKSQQIGLSPKSRLCRSLKMASKRFETFIRSIGIGCCWWLKTTV